MYVREVLDGVLLAAVLAVVHLEAAAHPRAVVALAAVRALHVAQVARLA